MNLECSSEGDRRFSAFYAIITFEGKTDSIENHYQLAKRFGNESYPKTWKEAKGRKPTHFHVHGTDYPVEMLTQFYNRLWAIYLDEHPELVEFLEGFDTFTDRFAKKGCNNQADAIARYMTLRKMRKLNG